MRAVVMGAGIIGAACARELAISGAEVVVIDRGGPAGGTTSHGEGNILVSDKPPGPELELARYSLSRWPEVIADEPRAEWDRKGGVVVATTEAGAASLRELAEAQRKAGVVADELDADALAAAEPHLTREVVAAVHYPEDAQVQPAAAATALLGHALRTGELVNAEVLGAVTRSGRLTGVRTTRGVVRGDVYVNAAGPWAGEVSRSLGAPIAVEPRRGEVLVTAPLPPTVFHKVYDADYVAAVGSDARDLQASAVVESTRAGTVLLGSARRRVGFDDRLRPYVLAEIARRALRLFPGLRDVPVIRAYGGFRPYVPDHLPVIGPDPRLPGLWHATGHEGAGICLAPGTGRLLADLITKRTPEVDPAPFRVDREGVLT